MKLSWWRFLPRWNLEGHEAWLAAQARAGFHYKSRFAGLDRFEVGAPGEFAFCWDRSPMWGKEAKVAYVKSRVDAGWRPAAETERLVCWRRPVETGQPAPALRDAGETREMRKRLYKDYLLWGAIFGYFTIRAGIKLATDSSSFRIGHSLMALMGAMYLPYVAYTVLRLRERL